MIRDALIKAVVIVAVAGFNAAAPAQPDPAAFVTTVAGKGAVRVGEGEPSQIAPTSFSFEQNGIRPGEGVRTADDGMAALMLPDCDAAVHLDSSTELRVVEPADSGVGAYLVLVGGRVSVVQKPDHDQWLLVAAEAGAAGVAGYTLSKGASLFVEADAEGASFAARHGEALYFPGKVPAGALIDASGRPVKSGVRVPQGRRISTEVPATTVPDEQPYTVVPSRHGDDMYKLALTHSDQWLRKAEQGDFTPVRAAARGAPEILSAELEPTPAFDQPRPVLTAPSPRPAPTAIRTTLDPGQALVQSNVPGSVIAGQRLLRSRIIANPGTSRTGALTVNRSARMPITLGGN